MIVQIILKTCSLFIQFKLKDVQKYPDGQVGVPAQSHVVQVQRQGVGAAVMPGIFLGGVFLGICTRIQIPATHPVIHNVVQVNIYIYIYLYVMYIYYRYKDVCFSCHFLFAGYPELYSFIHVVSFINFSANPYFSFIIFFSCSFNRHF